MTTERPRFLWDPRAKKFLGDVETIQDSDLALDYDGTLAGFNIDSMRAVPFDGVPELLDDISETGTKITFITGRPALELPQLLKLKKPVEIWGMHGWEHLSPEGVLRREPLTYHHRDALDEIKGWIPGVEAYGARGEIKYAGIVIHWRGSREDHIPIIKSYIEEKWTAVKQRLGRHMARYGGNSSIELRAQGCHKGKVIERLIRPGVPIVYLGDDHTDEDAFRTLNRLSDCSLSAMVEQEERRTDAAIRLSPPHEVIAFLKEFRDARQRGGWGTVHG